MGQRVVGRSIAARALIAPFCFDRTAVPSHATVVSTNSARTMAAIQQSNGKAGRSLAACACHHIALADRYAVITIQMDQRPAALFTIDRLATVLRG